jgi:hypothetical protein
MLTFQFINKSYRQIFKQKYLVTKVYIEHDRIRDPEPHPVFSEVGSGSASKWSVSATLVQQSEFTDIVAFLYISYCIIISDSANCTFS